MIKERIEAVAAGETYQKVKLHLRTNKKLYITGGSCLATGLLLGGTGRVRIINNVTPVIAPVMNNIVNNTVNLGGHMTKLVKCLETGEVWETVTDAAKAAGVALPAMSRHLNEHTDHIKGLHYAIIGVGTAG